MVCLTCRGLGMVGGCPSCGKAVSTEAPTIDLAEADVTAAAIPEYYLKTPWSKQTLLNSHADSKAKAALEKYAETLDRMYRIFSSGKIPGKSCLIIASHGMGKMVWAYSCMQEAMKHGYSIAPILDNTQYRRLSILSSERMYSKVLKQPYTIEDYNTADVLFLTIDPDNFQGSYRTVDSLLSKRARYGKPTFILSRYSVKQMSLIDFSDSFSSTLNSGAEQDKNKYILVIGG